MSFRALLLLSVAIVSMAAIAVSLRDGSATFITWAGRTQFALAIVVLSVVGFWNAASRLNPLVVRVTVMLLVYAVVLGLLAAASSIGQGPWRWPNFRATVIPRTASVLFVNWLFAAILARTGRRLTYGVGTESPKAILDSVTHFSWRPLLAVVLVCAALLGVRPFLDLTGQPVFGLRASFIVAMATLAAPFGFLGAASAWAMLSIGTPIRRVLLASLAIPVAAFLSSDPNRIRADQIQVNVLVASAVFVMISVVYLAARSEGIRLVSKTQTTITGEATSTH